MTADLDQLLDLALAIVDELAPAIVAGRDEGALAVDTKSSGTDMVTAMDRWSEARIHEAIADARPADGFLGEEGGRRPGTSGVVWVVDPIDGTTNCSKGLPNSISSIKIQLRKGHSKYLSHSTQHSPSVAHMLGGSMLAPRYRTMLG